MSVDANTGNAFLDSYARQINQLEKDPNATPEYDAALEKQFDAVKAQVLGDGGSTPGAGNGGPATTHGTGSSGATGSTGSKGGPGSPPATGSNSGTTPPPPVADSIGQITSTAGPDAAATVQKIADGAAASIGGSAGTSVAATAAQAGANAAQHVIDTGGTSAQAATAAQTAAQAVATAGAAGGPAAAANVATIADPATAQSVANTAAHAAETAGGGAVGSAIAAAVTRAGAAGGAAAAEAVATAAEIGGVAAATATADAAVFASVVAGGGAAGETAAATAAQAAADVAGRVHDAGGSADEAATASRLVADAAEAGGAKLAGDVASVVNMATLLGGTTNDMARLANDVTRAFNIGGAGTADAVVGTAGEVFGGAMLNQIAGNSAGSSLADIENVASTIVEAAEQGGPELAEDVASVVTTVASAGGTGANMTAAADAVTNAFVWGETAGAQAVRNAVESASSHGVADIADVASTVAEIVDDYGAGAAEEAVPAIVTVAAAGGSVADMTDVADAVASAFAEDGVDGAEAVVQAVQGASRSGVDNIASVASIVSNAVTEHGSAFAQDVGQAVDMVAAAGGDADNMRETAEALDLAFQHGRQDTADAVVRAAQAVADVGGNGKQITDISYTVAESAEALFLSGEGNQPIWLPLWRALHSARPRRWKAPAPPTSLRLRAPSLIDPRSRNRRPTLFWLCIRSVEDRARSLGHRVARGIPFLPRNLVARLHEAVVEQNAQLAVAASGGQSHPVIGLWSVGLRDELRHALVVEDIRKIDRWTARYKLATVAWPAEPLDPFFNANTMDDIAAAEQLTALEVTSALTGTAFQKPVAVLRPIFKMISLS